MVDIVKKIDDLRITKGWTIYKLADEAQISQQAFHQWVKTNTMPSIPVLERICGALGITIAELFSENELIEASPRIKQLYKKWSSLTESEQNSIEQIVDNYIANKN